MAASRGPVFVLALVGAIALGAALALWLERGEGEHAQAEEAAREQGAREALRAAGGLAEVEPDGAARREPVASEASRAAPVPDGPALPTGVLAGRVLDANGRPLAGARVTLARAEARSFDVLDTGLERDPEPAGETTSGEDGAFRFELARGSPVDVLATLEGYSDALAVDAYAGQELELVLARGVLVFGTITRARDRAPVAAARVRVFRLGGPASLERETRSRADGSYELRVPFRDGLQLEVVPDGLQCSPWIALEVGPDERCERDVVLEEGVLVTGRVTAADTGLPIAGARVGEGWWFRRWVETDARGEYRLTGFGDPGVREIGARARGYGAARSENPPPARDGVVRLDFALVAARSVHGRVVDERGAPLADVYVAAVASEFEDGGQRTDWLSARTDREGRYRIEDLSSDLGHALFLARHGYGTKVHDLPESEFETRDLELPDVVLERPALLAGHVEDPGGNPLPGVEVELSGWNHDRYRFTRGPTARARYYVDQRAVRTDARGRFWFGDVAAGSYALVTRSAGRPQSAPLALEVAAGEPREDLVLRLDAGGTIRGQVLDEHGRALAGVYVSAQGERLRDPDARPAGHVHVRTADDGEFVLEGLPPGDYTLRAYPLETPAPSPDEPWLPATVEHVATGAQPIRIELARGASLRGRVLDARGAPLSGYVVAAVGAGEAGEFARTDVQGRFALGVPRGSSWTLEVRGAPQSEAFQEVFLRREGVRAGAGEIELRLDE